jgi:hypothetical protein
MLVSRSLNGNVIKKSHNKHAETTSKQPYPPGYQDRCVTNPGFPRIADALASNASEMVGFVENA